MVDRIGYLELWLVRIHAKKFCPEIRDERRDECLRAYDESRDLADRFSVESQFFHDSLLSWGTESGFCHSFQLELLGTSLSTLEIDCQRLSLKTFRAIRGSECDRCVRDMLRLRYCPSFLKYDQPKTSLFSDLDAEHLCGVSEVFSDDFSG